LTTEKKCKGVPKKALALKKFEDYRRMLFINVEDDWIDSKDKVAKALARKKLEDQATFRRIDSKKHSIRHVQQRKRCLSCNSDKVYMISETSSRPLGHKRNRDVE